MPGLAAHCEIRVSSVLQRRFRRWCPRRVLYFGSGQCKARVAVDLCQSAARLNANGMSVDFDVVSPALQIEAHRDALSIHPAIRLIELMQDDGEFFAALTAADALVLAINHDAETVEFIRYFMPTKVPARKAPSAGPGLARTRHDTVRVRVHFEDVLKAAARTSQ